MGKKTVTFLFGAGCEGAGQFELPSGNDFFSEIFLEKHEEILNALEKFFGKTKYFIDYKYTRDELNKQEKIFNLIFKNRAKSDEQFFKDYYKIAKNILSKSDYDEITKQLQSENNSEESESKDFDDSELDQKDYIKCFTSNILKCSKNSNVCKENLCDICNEREKCKYPFVRDLLQDNDNYKDTVSGMLDSYFHTIINPPKFGNKRFSKIFNYYWVCYFVIVSGILKLDDEYFKEYTRKGLPDYGKILNEFNAFTEKLYKFDQYKEKHSYYKIISERLKQLKNWKCEGVLTTNYYKFVDILNENVAYLNGSLNLVEIPEIHEVIDATSKDNMELCENRLFFPFIFGQSFVKPIIHKKQIETFYNAYGILEKSDVLVVLGYGINEDDNHINAMLRSYLGSNKENKLIIVVSKNDEKNDVVKRIRCEDFTERIDFCKVENYDDLEEIVNLIFAQMDNMAK